MTQELAASSVYWAGMMTAFAIAKRELVATIGDKTLRMSREEVPAVYGGDYVYWLELRNGAATVLRECFTTAREMAARGVELTIQHRREVQ